MIITGSFVNVPLRSPSAAFSRSALRYRLSFCLYKTLIIMKRDENDLKQHMQKRWHSQTRVGTQTVKA